MGYWGQQLLAAKRARVTKKRANKLSKKCPGSLRCWTARREYEYSFFFLATPKACGLGPEINVPSVMDSVEQCLNIVQNTSISGISQDGTTCTCTSIFWWKKLPLSGKLVVKLLVSQRSRSTVISLSDSKSGVSFFLPRQSGFSQNIFVWTSWSKNIANKYSLDHAT